MAGRVIKRLLAGVLTVAVVIPGNFVPAQAAEEPQEDYLIYPNPHKVEYQEGDYILGKELNVIYDKGIDEATKNRLQEAADLKGIEVNEAEQPKEGATNVYVGVHGQDGTAEDYITEEYQPEDSLFGKTDSYFLASDENVISVLGKDADSAFYGLTTLYHVFAQMDSLTIRNFEIEDYADVVSRGFIEGLWKSVVYRRSCKLDEMGWILQIKRVFLCAERRPETSYTVGSALYGRRAGK